jgi:hypothetical protein
MCRCASDAWKTASARSFGEFLIAVPKKRTNSRANAFGTRFSSSKLNRALVRSIVKPKGLRPRLVQFETGSL